MAPYLESTLPMPSHMPAPHGHSLAAAFAEHPVMPEGTTNVHLDTWPSNHSGSHPTSFIGAIVGALFGRDKPDQVQYTGIVRDPHRKWTAKHPGSPAGWSVLAYQSAQRAREAAEVAERAQESAEKFDMIARACADQTKAALAQVEITVRVPRHIRHNRQELEACDHVRAQVMQDPESSANFHVAKRLKECKESELIDFCEDLRQYIKATDSQPGPDGKLRRQDKEIVQLRKFCGTLEAEMDKESSVAGSAGESPLAKIGVEEGFTLYDAPPDTHDFPLTEPPWLRVDRFSTPMRPDDYSYNVAEGGATHLAVFALLPGFLVLPARAVRDSRHVAHGHHRNSSQSRWNQFI